MALTDLSDLGPQSSGGVRCQARGFFDHGRDHSSFADSDSVNLGPFVAGYDSDIRLEDGSIDLRNDNTARVNELDIDPIVFKRFIGIDISELRIGGFCIIPSPWGCILRAPRIARALETVRDG